MATELSLHLSALISQGAKPWEVKHVWELDDKEMLDYVIHLEAKVTSLERGLSHE